MDMKQRYLLTLLLLLCSMVGARAQAYLGNTTTQVNLRGGPGTNYPVLRSLDGGTQLFVVSNETVDGFYEVIYIMTNTEGYVHNAFVRLVERVELNEEGVFTPAGRSTTQDPELKIYNNTSRTLTLKMNDVTYTFSPQERRTLTVGSGRYEYRASAPGVIPDIGLEFLDSRTSYSWEFYITTQY